MNRLYRWKARFWRGMIYFLLVLLMFIFLAPVYIVLVTSFKRVDEVNIFSVWQLPRGLHFDLFATAFGTLHPYLVNSLMLIPASVFSAILGSMNGYVLSKWRLPGERTTLLLIVIGMFIPYQSILVPLFQLLRALHLYGTLAGLVLTHTVYGLPITTLIFFGFYSEIPREMTEASQIDGADFLGIYRDIVLPLSAPGFGVALIWQFTQIWNEYLFALTMTRQESWPITVGLSQLGSGQATNYGVQMAGSLLTALPALLVYILPGRFFVRGMLSGAMTG